MSTVVTSSPMPQAVVEPEHVPDLLAGAALRSLSREVPVRAPWGPAKTVLLALVTFGVAPLLTWPKSLRMMTTMERQQLWHLAEWMRLRSGHVEAGKLSELAERIRFRRVLWAGSLACLAMVVVAFVVRGTGVGWTLHDLRAVTYSFGNLTPARFSMQSARELFLVWTIGLCLAYFLHWLHIQLHTAEVRRFVSAFNAIAAREQIAPVEVKAVGMGVRPVWTIGAVVMVAVGAIWAIPMVFAGVLQTRLRQQSRSVRSGLADALRCMLLVRRPVMYVPRPVNLGLRCGNDLCRAAVPPLARYCPRCGLAVSGREETAERGEAVRVA